MSTALVFMAKWRKWQRVLRCRKGFGLIGSVRFGLWLARGSAASAPKVEPRDQIFRSAHAT